MIRTLLLLGCMPALLSAAGLEARWWSVSCGAEVSRFADEAPSGFQDAEGWTRSVHVSAGRQARWLAAGGVSDQRLRQDSWNNRSLKRSIWLWRALSPRWGVEAFGQARSSSLSWPVLGGEQVLGGQGWHLGGGVAWCPAPFGPAPLSLGVRGAMLRPAEAGDSGTRDGTVELGLTRAAGMARQSLALLGGRVDGDWDIAALARASGSLGRLDWQGGVLLGHQDQWFDVERLVQHDGAELRAAAHGGMGWRLWRGVSLEGVAGWEKVEGSENRWLYLAVRWTRSSWHLEEREGRRTDG